MKRATTKSNSRRGMLAAAFGLALGLALAPSNALACAACYGASDSLMAKGFNWGIISLLTVVVVVLGSIVSFFVYLARRAAAFQTPASLVAAPRESAACRVPNDPKGQAPLPVPSH